MRMSEMTDAYVKLDKVSKIYGTKEVKIVAVDEISFEIAKGEFVVIVGPSGAGKTTVLNILGGMDQATSGEVLVDGRNIARYNSRQLTGYRRNDIGFVFQFYNLVPNLTALENVELALQICKNPLDAREVLEEVGLKDRLTNFPAQLSGGEQQRVSIARALAKNPKLLLCDEPTGALDYQTGKAILKLLQDMCRERGMTVIVITHNSALTPMADSILVSLLLANLCHLLSELLVGCGNLAAFVVGKNTFALCGSFHRTDRMRYLGIKYLDFLTVCTFDRCRNFLSNIGTGHYHSH